MFGDSFRPEPRTGVLLRRYGQDAAAWDVAVAMPEGPAPDRGFPLLVVLDGALHFDAAVAAARALARRPGKTEVGPMIVLGIASGRDWSHDAERRERALLPGAADNAALHAVLRLALDEVAAMAPVDPVRRAVMGHSFGGLFALDALVREPGLFGTCIALSPSLWNAPGLAENVAAALAGRDARILLASGEQEPQINADLPAAAAILAEVARVERAVLPGEDHGSIPFAALPMALRFVHGVIR